MGRSLFSNRQALDDDYAFQHELDNASGTLNTKIDTTSGTLQDQHDTHLVSDDHLIYVPRDGTRGFTSTVSGVYPIKDFLPSYPLAIHLNRCKNCCMLHQIKHNLTYSYDGSDQLYSTRL